MKYILMTAAVLTLFSGAMADSAAAGEVSISGVHLCCGACVRDVGKALADVEGVANVACDRATKVVTFVATDAKSAVAGVTALAKGGFHGDAKFGDKTIEFPASGAKPGDKADSVTITGVHLCCGGCVNAASKAVKAEAAGATVNVDRDSTSVSVTGKGLDIAALVNALNKAGFHGTVKQ